ncbi:uncharacterized protein [Amphiura filiformis]|uniref:uncharacterized protein n=1 Tax=Amphiura filiformis TaxID=82378 RepID=UPI003B217C79
MRTTRYKVRHTGSPQTRCVPSAASLVDSQVDVHTYLSPTPSFESDIQGQLDIRTTRYKVRHTGSPQTRYAPSAASLVDSQVDVHTYLSPTPSFESDIQGQLDIRTTRYKVRHTGSPQTRCVPSAASLVDSQVDVHTYLSPTPSFESDIQGQLDIRTTRYKVRHTGSPQTICVPSAASLVDSQVDVHTYLSPTPSFESDIQGQLDIRTTRYKVRHTGSPQTRCDPAAASLVDSQVDVHTYLSPTPSFESDIQGQLDIRTTRYKVRHTGSPQTRCVPSAASLVDSQVDVHTYLSPTPSFESDIQGQLDIRTTRYKVRHTGSPQTRGVPSAASLVDSQVDVHTYLSPTPSFESDIHGQLDMRYEVRHTGSPQTRCVPSAASLVDSQVDVHTYLSPTPSFESDIHGQLDMRTTRYKVRHTGSPQTRCVPSAASLVDSQVDFHTYLSPTPSFESDIQGQLDIRYPTPQNTPRSPLKAPLNKIHPTPETALSAHQPDLGYILESRYKIALNERPKTFEAKSLVKPFKTRGPDSFPLREPKTLPKIRHEFLYMDVDDPRYHERPEFTLEDFTIDLKDVRTYPRERLKQAIFSKHNYKKMTTLFASFADKPTQDHVHTVQLKGEDIPEVIPRVPQQQLLLEMAFIIRTQMRQIANDEILSVMPYNATPGQLMMVPDSSPVRQLMPAAENGSDYPSCKEQAIFNVPTAKHFQGSRRTDSPFSDVESSATINPSELAILDCLVNGGLALSLKAHFIASIPEMSPLVKTITYLNLSFNDFMIFPSEVLSLKNLTVLKMRNNPLKEIPDSISNLSRLKTFVVSFCLLSSLPLGMFQLPLQFLDVSFNKLTYLPNEIKNLKKVRALNVEGNQIPAMPSGALKLRRLRYLRVFNNFMHPLFWKDNSHNEPQRLTDLSAVVFTENELETRYQLSQDVTKLLQSYTTCDCCQGAVFGPGLRIIRPCSQAFGVKKLPFLFTCCSPHCRDWFMESVESLTSILYEEDGDEDGGGELVLRDAGTPTI